MIEILFPGTGVGSATEKKVGKSNSIAASSAGFQTQLNKALKAPSNLEDIFSRAAARYQVPENLLKAVAKVESNFDADAVSRCGATGIMQLMPSTAKSLGVNDLYDPEQNIMGGAKELSDLLKRYDGDVKMALAGYNAGIGNVAKYGGIPPFAETQAYVKKVMQIAGQTLTIPNTSNSASSNTVPVGGNSSSTSGIGEEGITQDAIQEALFGNPEEDYTYEDYQLFLELYLTQIRREANGIDKDSMEKGMFWL